MLITMLQMLSPLQCNAADAAGGLLHAGPRLRLLPAVQGGAGGPALHHRAHQVQQLLDSGE